MEQERGYGTGLWAWLLQRITGLLLVIYLFIHIWWIHFSSIKTPLDFLLNILFVSGTTSVLILVVLILPHALNGFRVFAIDLGISERAQKILFWALMVFGVILILWIYLSGVSG